jgi:hypothetical protein
MGVDIMNDEALRLIPAENTRTNVEDETHKFQHILDLGARIVLIVGMDPIASICLEKFYDLGVRRGNLVFMGIEYLHM